MQQGWRAVTGLARPPQGVAAGLRQLVGRAMGWAGPLGGTTAAELPATVCQLQQVRGMANHRHKKIVKMAKGYRGRTNCFRIAVQKVEKALQYAYRDRKVKKREFRSLWIQRINAAVQQYGISYNRFVPGLRTANITLDRKVLSELAVTEPYSFKAVVDTVKSALPTVAASGRQQQQAVAAGARA